MAFNRLSEDQRTARHRPRRRSTSAWQFAAQAAPNQLPGYAVRYYIDTLAASPDALHGSFGIYRALATTIAQNQQRMTAADPAVLAIGGGESLGEEVGNTMKLTADDVQTMVIPGCGH